MHQVLSETLDFFVSILWKQIVTQAWLYTIIQKKARQQVLLPVGRMILPCLAGQALDSAGWSGIRCFFFLTCNLCLIDNNTLQLHRTGWCCAGPRVTPGPQDVKPPCPAHGARGRYLTLRLWKYQPASPWAFSPLGCNCLHLPLDCKLPRHLQSLLFDCVQCCH